MSAESDGIVGRPPDPSVSSSCSVIGSTIAGAMYTCLDNNMDLECANVISVDSSERKLVSEKSSTGKISKAYRNIKESVKSSKPYRNSKESLREEIFKRSVNLRDKIVGIDNLDNSKDMNSINVQSNPSEVRGNNTMIDNSMISEHTQGNSKSREVINMVSEFNNITSDNSVNNVNIQVNSESSEEINMESIPINSESSNDMDSINMQCSSEVCEEVNMGSHLNIPNTVNNAARFDACDKGPFVVYIESIDKNIGRLHPMSLGKIIHNTGVDYKFGIAEISSIGINKIKLEFKNAKIANKFLECNVLDKNKYKAYIPRYVLFRQGIIFDVDPNLTKEEILDVIESDIPIIDVVCLRSKNIGVHKAQCVKIIFRGADLPNKVAIHSVKCEVRPFIPRIVQCFKCCRFNHIKEQCRGKQQCMKCAGEHNEDNCDASELLCVLCKGEHPANSKVCPIFMQNKVIKEMMAMQNIPYHEARDLIRRDTYASKTKSKFVSFDKNNDFPVIKSNTNHKQTSGPVLNHINRFDVLSDMEGEERNDDGKVATISRPKRYGFKTINRKSEIKTNFTENKKEELVSAAVTYNQLETKYSPRKRVKSNSEHVTVDRSIRNISEQYKDSDKNIAEVMKLMKEICSTGDENQFKLLIFEMKKILNVQRGGAGNQHQ